MVKGLERIHLSVVYLLTGFYILLYGFYNMENGLYSLKNVATAVSTAMICGSITVSLVYIGDNYDIILNSLLRLKKKSYEGYTCGLWFVLLILASILVSGVFLLNDNPYNNFKQECADGEFVLHVPGNSPTCEACDPCNFDYASCNEKTGACVCDSDGADPSKQCNECFDGFSIETGCTECRNHYSTESFCTACQVGWDIEQDCNGCSVGWTGENCDQCAPDYFGNPLQSCSKCDCEYGTCVSNDVQLSEWSPDVCTRTAKTCSSSLDCADTGNCAGVCRSKLQSPGRAEVAEYENKVCQSDADCGPTVDFYFGFCDQKVCCTEYKYGTGNCVNCPDGRKEPRCALCKGYDSTYDVYCNGHGTCLGTSTGVVCGCETGYSGAACERAPDFQCVAGFFGPMCTPCNGVENLNGLSACNLKTGNAKECDVVGNCICSENKFYKFTGESCSECALGYAGDNCLRCPGWELSDVNGTRICGGHGTCVADDYGRPICQCDEGYLVDAYLSCVENPN